MSSCDRLSHATCTRCRNSAMVVEGSGERVNSRFIMSHTCSIDESSRVIAGQGKLRRSCPAEEAHYLPFEEMAIAEDNDLCNETPNMIASCNWWLPTPWSLRWGECTPKDDAHQNYVVHVYVHLSLTDRNYSHHWRQQSAIPLSSRLFHDSGVAVLVVMV